MKKLLFACLPMLLVSCGTTESKIKSSIKEYEKSQLKDGENLENLQIDSLSYYLGNTRSVYANEMENNMAEQIDNAAIAKTLTDFYMEKIDSIHTADHISTQAATDKLFEIDSILVQNRRVQKSNKILDSLMNNGDTTKEIYIVKYTAKKSTNRNSDKVSRTIYLTKDFGIYTPLFNWLKYSYPSAK